MLQQFHFTLFVLKRLLLLALLVAICNRAFTQHDMHNVFELGSKSNHHPPDSVKHKIFYAEQYDISDLFTDLFYRKNKTAKSTKRSAITVMPNIALNPTIGAQGGIKAVAGKILGDQANTTMSVAATSASITTKGITVFYLTHNIFMPSNTWNLQGSIAAVHMIAPDAGIGMNINAWKTTEERVVANPDRKIYGSMYNSFIFYEKVYRKITKGLFLGAGVSFDIRRKINESQLVEGPTPSYLYNTAHNFNPKKYNSNGLLFNVEYITRDHPNRAYKGMYVDIGLRMNQTWIGSSQHAIQMVTDFRKYVSLSSQNPDHVLAFWYWGSYRINGFLPYFDLPGTGKDASVRTGRGYTFGYFKGISFAYSEVEYRFPILENRFVSGVTFFHMQSASDEIGTKLFQRWQPGGGAGLRVLFNKATRTNLCLDYAFGKYGNKGFFLGLNEAF